MSNLESVRKLDKEVQSILKLIPHGYEFKVVTKTRKRINAGWLAFFAWIIEIVVMVVLYNTEATSSDLQGQIGVISTVALPLIAFVCDVTQLEVPWLRKKYQIRVLYGSLYTEYGQISASRLIQGEGVDPVSLFAELDKALLLQFTKDDKLDTALPLAKRVKERAMEKAAVRAEMQKLG